MNYEQISYCQARMDVYWRSVLAAAIWTLRSINLNGSSTKFVTFMCEPNDNRYAIPLAEVTYDKEKKGISRILYLPTKQIVIFP